MNKLIMKIKIGTPCLIAICFTISNGYCQKKTYAEIKKEDSIKVASIPASVKEATNKKIPGNYEIKWTVLNNHYMAEFNILKPDAKSYLSEDGDVNMQFYKGGANDGKWCQTSIKYHTEPEIVKAVPSDVLKKIKNKLIELNNEELSGIEIVECAEKCIRKGRTKPGEPYSDEPYASKGYWVWGKKTGTNIRGMLSFTSEGELIPSVW
ncbi:MAG: hypothetical protein ABIR06_03175 [Cyclobacteriaceae bacterium]